MVLSSSNPHYHQQQHQQHHNIPQSGNYGLSTKIALKRLHDDIKDVLKRYENKFESENIFFKIRSSFIKRYESPLGWFSIFTTILVIIGLLIIGQFVASTIIFIILALNLYFVVRENNLRRTELFRKLHNVLNEIKLAEDELCTEWETYNYPHLCCPVSPCVTLQWTYRDGSIINLPWALLVRGDCIVIRPGQVSPGLCTEINGKCKFRLNETYGIGQAQELPTRPKARPPLPDLLCTLENTPYLNNLEIMLENFLKRPPTIYNQQRYLLVTKYIQQWGFCVAIIVVITCGIFSYVGIGMSKGPKDWKAIFIDRICSAIIPILPLIFPLMWIAINLWGIARLQIFLQTPQIKMTYGEEKSFQEDLDTPTYDYDSVQISRREVLRHWLSLWKGSGELLGRSANVVQVLGSITALCCVDKKGILSWPNPTAEKIFFLHDSEDKTPATSSQASLGSEQIENFHHQPPNHHTVPTAVGDKTSKLVAEVLDLTHDQHCPFKLEFDDHEWKNHISSLKPLGLAILLNTCNALTHTHYAQFCGHVTAVAMLDKDLVPVTNRRCLCELAKQIGFTSHATDLFNLEGQLATYRHLQPEIVRRDIRFARQMQLQSKVKVPFPHSLSVVLREAPGGYLSLFTQGTADIVLDCCDDFWDGKDLRPLGPQERKRAQDFYQRSALTAYCTAFAYRPLRHSICGVLSGSPNNCNTAYLELPPESKYKMTHADKAHCDFVGHTKLSHSISTDSLLFSETKDDDIADVEGCFEMQCHQVFIGMVTMQYQAQTDIVQLVERLERACIRFVHFSKENELRSRVFSEKMGLESGWNCHISLLSEEPQSNPQSPKNSAYNFDVHSQQHQPQHQQQQQHNASIASASKNDDENNADTDLNCLLQPIGLESTKTLSSSAPGAISNHDYNMLNVNSENASNESLNCMITEDIENNRHRSDSALDENCQSLSILTDSTEQSAPVPFDMSNRAKLPRGIENIRPHLEKVDNVPLQVSLFTDCSPEATKEMLSIMQSYGEIVVCIGSSASNANSEIFLQADCSIAIEPLYPQVCQDIPAYTESNILNNKLKNLKMKSKNSQIINQSSKNFGDNNQSVENGLLDGIGDINNYTSLLTHNNTLSPIYISRMLNSLPCSISVCRDDPLSIVAIIELSRRFSLGLWNCIQFWACCSCTLTVINVLSSCFSLPPIFTPLTLIYLMIFAIPLISFTLTHIELDPKIMNRATGKKQTQYDSKVFGYVLWCYGCKFISCIIIMILSYCAFMAHPIEILDIDEKRFEANLKLARIFSLLGVVLHFVIISSSFVHRDHSIWNKNPFSNRLWTMSILLLLSLHVFITYIQIIIDDVYDLIPTVWPIIVVILLSSLLSFIVTEICKWEEIKVNLRYQRRARLDFGTKLGMNSPF